MGCTLGLDFPPFALLVCEDGVLQEKRGKGFPL